MRQTHRIAAILFTLGVVLAPALPAQAEGPVARPFEFVGTAADCGTHDAARIVAAQWMQGIGLPDKGATNEPGNPPANTDIEAKKDKRVGLLLAKTGPTPVCAAAGARIQHFGTIEVGPGTTLGYDVRRGSHCSGGAPRFNVSTEEGGFYFVGACTQSYATSIPAPQDSTGWTRVRFNLVGAGIPPGHTLSRISIVFDEGTDTGDGLAVIDNIQVGGDLITGVNRSIDE
jgi:hypothetical protein